MNKHFTHLHPGCYQSKPSSFPYTYEVVWANGPNTGWIARYVSPTRTNHPWGQYSKVFKSATQAMTYILTHQIPTIKPDFAPGTRQIVRYHIQIGKYTYSVCNQSSHNWFVLFTNSKEGLSSWDGGVFMNGFRTKRDAIQYVVENAR
jgi:hypothetical protein